MSEDTSNAAGAAGLESGDCANCGTPLQGKYCHACGQNVHSPVQSFLHALEEVFESFWHLDGRVFRTVRDLFSPGRVACNYLAGQRVRYIQPLRLFVILCLLTFFVGKLTVHLDDEVTDVDSSVSRIEAAQTIPEVERIRDETLADMRLAEKEAAKVPGVKPALIAARVRVEGQAANRIAQLRKAQEGGAPATGADAAPAAPASTAGPPAGPKAGVGASVKKTGPVVLESDDEWKFNDRPWNEKTNPVDIGWLPDFADRWVNHKIGRAQENLANMDDKPDRFMQAFLGTVPTALFLLMPVFALLLKLFYLGSGKLYLEHMVVALYSHAWLLLMLLGGFILGAITGSTAAPWVAIVGTFVAIGMWVWVPAYLFVMQLRVYREHWLITTLKFFMIGSIYVFLVGFATAIAFLAGIVS
jgi:hypothetical protein